GDGARRARRVASRACNASVRPLARRRRSERRRPGWQRRGRYPLGGAVRGSRRSRPALSLQDHPCATLSRPALFNEEGKFFRIPLLVEEGKEKTHSPPRRGGVARSDGVVGFRAAADHPSATLSRPALLNEEGKVQRIPLLVEEGWRVAPGWWVSSSRRPPVRDTVAFCQPCAASRYGRSSGDGHTLSVSIQPSSLNEEGKNPRHSPPRRGEQVQTSPKLVPGPACEAVVPLARQAMPRNGNP